MGDAARGIYRDQGVRGLYRGLGVTLVEIVPYAALQFGLYDAFSAAWDGAKVHGGGAGRGGGRGARWEGRRAGAVGPAAGAG